MAHKRDYKPEDIAFPNQVITESELVGEMEDSYRDYAMSVIVGRALPDVRDGLKPVHRRILLYRGETIKNIQRDAARHRQRDRRLGSEL